VADHNLTLQLDDIRELFVAPEVDPFSPREVAVVGEPGLVRMVRRYAALWHAGTIHLTVQLPADTITPETAGLIRAGITRYCSLKTEANDELLRLRRRIGLRSLLTGLLFLGVALLLAALFASDALSTLPRFLRTILSEGFTIIGWVALWHPFEALVYDPIPLRRENAIYRRLPGIEISVEPSPARPAPRPALAPH
jgi:hypothetical protein